MSKEIWQCPDKCVMVEVTRMSDGTFITEQGILIEDGQLICATCKGSIGRKTAFISITSATVYENDIIELKTELPGIKSITVELEAGDGMEWVREVLEIEPMKGKKQEKPKIQVERVIIYEREDADTIILFLDLPPLPKVKSIGPISVEIKASKLHGAEWVRRTLGIDPIIGDTR